MTVRQLVASPEQGSDHMRISIEQLGPALEPREWQGLTDAIQSVYSDGSGGAGGVGRSTNGRIHTFNWNKGLEVWRRCWAALGLALEQGGLELQMSDTAVTGTLMGRAVHEPSTPPKTPEAPPPPEVLPPSATDAAVHMAVLPVVEQSLRQAIQDSAGAAIRVTELESELDAARTERDNADIRLGHILNYLERYKPDVSWRKKATKEIMEAKASAGDDDDEDKWDSAAWDR